MRCENGVQMGGVGGENGVQMEVRGAGGVQMVREGMRVCKGCASSVQMGAGSGVHAGVRGGGLQKGCANGVRGVCKRACKAAGEWKWCAGACKAIGLVDGCASWETGRARRWGLLDGRARGRQVCKGGARCWRGVQGRCQGGVRAESTGGVQEACKVLEGPQCGRRVQGDCRGGRTAPRCACKACKGRARLDEGAAGGWAERPGARARGVQGSVIRAQGVQGAHKARLGGAKGRATGVQRACKAQCGAAGGGRGGGRLHNPPLVSHVGPRVSPCPWGRAGVLVQKEGSPCKWRGPRANGGVPVCVCAPPCPRGRANRRVPIVAPPHARVPVHVLVQAVQIRAQMSPPLHPCVCVGVGVAPRGSSWPCKLWCPHTAVSSCKSQCHHCCPHVCPRVLVAVQIAVPPIGVPLFPPPRAPLPPLVQLTVPHRCPFMPTPPCPLARPRANHSAPHRCPRVWMSP